MIRPQWLELPMSRINFHDAKDVRTTEILLQQHLLHEYIYLSRRTEAILM